ncbi:hypothetical protein HH214_00915 [Mucilaginibacter robiniae]|uniref:Uncharacterized protein n=1 Tax=Mucilaginibacter robiniae TaxID=2728022 RepID=A0A7L5DU03_9SPHI|nr:hypothetical protein [Mucilaginibacter robiniae]QJD94532.1 hypothetical protein HH214_00915 [Mucilaginibacter robiniae]
MYEKLNFVDSTGIGWGTLLYANNLSSTELFLKKIEHKSSSAAVSSSLNMLELEEILKK